MTPPTPLPLYDTIKGTLERFPAIGETKLRELGAENEDLFRKLGKRVLVNQPVLLAILESLPGKPPPPQPIERAERGRFLKKTEG
jgi:hypothetical protein